MKVGVSCGSNEPNLINTLTRLRNIGEINYVELYIVENTPSSLLDTWRRSGLGFTVHVPHDNWGNTGKEQLNEALFWSDGLRASRLIYDAGTEKCPSLPHSEDLFCENMPMYTSFGERTNLFLPDPGYKNVCFDFAHAFLTAENLGISYTRVWKDFLKTKPKHFHVSNTSSVDYDDHCPLKDGQINILEVLPLIPKDGWVTIEPEHTGEKRIDRLVADIEFFQTCRKLSQLSKPD